MDSSFVSLQPAPHDSRCPPTVGDGFFAVSPWVLQPFGAFPDSTPNNCNRRLHKPKAVLSKSLPLDTDNDLLVVNDALTPAAGVVTYVSGRILDSPRGSDPQRPGGNLAVRRSRVYLHPDPTTGPNRDRNFRGFAASSPDPGEYLFRTIRPVPYPGGPPAHPLQDRRGGKGPPDHPVLYIKGHLGNPKDGVWVGSRIPSFAIWSRWTSLRSPAPRPANSRPGLTSSWESHPKHKSSPSLHLMKHPFLLGLALWASAFGLSAQDWAQARLEKSPRHLGG